MQQYVSVCSQFVTARKCLVLSIASDVALFQLLYALFHFRFTASSHAYCEPFSTTILAISIEIDRRMRVGRHGRQ